MSGAGSTLRVGAGWVALIALGLVMGFVVHMLKPDRKVTQVEFPWRQAANNPASSSLVPGVEAADPALQKLPPFALRATIVATDPAQSTAIFDLGNGRIHSLRPGSSLPGVGLLIGVADRSVQLEIGGRSVLFTFNDSTLDAGEPLAPIQSLAREIMANGPEGAVLQEASAPGATARSFVVPATSPRYSDAPRDEPELNATPRPGQSIDTTVWD